VLPLGWRQQLTLGADFAHDDFGLRTFNFASTETDVGRILQRIEDIGAGLEVIHLGTDAGDVLSAQFVYDFTLPLTVYVPYARAGHYFYLGSRDKVLLSVFAWAGAEYDITRGDLHWSWT
jgi:hypothetical protein